MEDVKHLQTFQHPKYGSLTVLRGEGRSKVCRRFDGTEVRIGTRVVNRLRSAEARTLPLSLSASGAADSLADHVTEVLRGMEDGPERIRIAREVWVATDGFLST